MKSDARIAMLIAPKGFQDIEFSVPRNFFMQKGATVDVYSTVKGTATGSFGSTFAVEHSLKDLNVNQYDAIVFIGGPGTPILRAHPNSVKIAKEAYDSGKIVGAICWSPTILANAGILGGKSFTVWIGTDPEYKMKTDEYISSKGGNYTADDVTIDGNIVTANGPMAAQEYAEKLWQLIIR
jgi:protease I